MQGFKSKAEDMILDARQKSGTWDAKAQSGQAPIWAPISGHGASTGVIQELRLRPALPQRRRRDEERDEGPRDGKPLRSDKDSV